MERLKLDRNYIKLFGAFAMTLDHIAVVVFFGYGLESLLSAPPAIQTIGIIFRVIGRFAFPIFCFFLVEGYMHTRNRVKYLARMAICAIVSEIPFDLCISSQLFDFSHQNTIFTLIIGLIAIMCIDKAGNLKDNRILVQVLAFISCSIAATLLNLDYKWGGVTLIVALYVFRNNTKLRLVFSAISLVFCGAGEIIGVLSIIIANKYNGNKHKLKYFFYVFYPLHLVVLHIISFYLKS